MKPHRVLERAAAPLSGAVAVVFAGLSAVRRKRIFHPRGAAFEAALTFHDGQPFPFSGTHRALVRLSRGVGLPQGLPDLLGLAVKVPELGQDLLLVTSGEGAVSRHLFVPATRIAQRPYSSVLPYEFEGRTIVFGARPRDEATFELTWGPAGTRDVHPLATLAVERAHDDDVAFNPFNCHPALKPAGGLNRLRRESYERSQRARPGAAA